MTLALTTRSGKANIIGPLNLYFQLLDVDFEIVSKPDTTVSVYLKVLAIRKKWEAQMKIDGGLRKIKMLED